MQLTPELVNTLITAFIVVAIGVLTKMLDSKSKTIGSSEASGNGSTIRSLARAIGSQEDIEQELRTRIRALEAEVARLKAEMVNEREADGD